MPSWNEQGDGLADAWSLFTRRPGVLGESYPVGLICSHVFAPSASGQLYLTSVLVQKGQTVTNIGFKTGSTAGVTPTNWWYGIWTHDTAGSPVIPASTVVSMVRVSTSTTVTVAASGTTPQSLAGRAVTGTGIPASSWVVSQPTPQTALLNNAATASGTSNLTFGQYAGPRQNIAVTTDSTTATVPTADTYHTKPISPTPWICPGTGLYLFGWMLAATTQASLVARACGSTGGTATWSHLISFSSGPHTTPPGAANPLTSVAGVTNWTYAYFT